jgi:hypothetical protein
MLVINNGVVINNSGGGGGGLIPNEHGAPDPIPNLVYVGGEGLKPPARF